MCLFYQDDVAKAFTHIQYLLKLDPNHDKALKIYKVVNAFGILV